MYESLSCQLRRTGAPGVRFSITLIILVNHYCVGTIFLFVFFIVKLNIGPSQLKSDYGIIIAEMCGFTEAVIEDAKATKTKMLEKRSQDALRTKGTAEQAHDMSALMRRLLLLQDSSMHAVALRAYLQNLRDACTTKMDGGDGNNV